MSLSDRAQGKNLWKSIQDTRKLAAELRKKKRGNQDQDKIISAVIATAAATAAAVTRKGEPARKGEKVTTTKKKSSPRIKKSTTCAPSGQVSKSNEFKSKLNEQGKLPVVKKRICRGKRPDTFYYINEQGTVMYLKKRQKELYKQGRLEGVLNPYTPSSDEKKK